MMTITEFCDKHYACHEVRNWALRECKTMDDVWRKAKPELLLWVATRHGVVDDATLRLFAVECARSVQHLMKDKRSINAIDVAYRYAIGEATESELEAARAAAMKAARAAWAAESAALDAASAALDAASAAWAAARAAWAAARAAWAAESAALDAASAAWAAARASRAASEEALAAWAAHAELMRGMATPCFDEVE